MMIMEVIFDVGAVGMAVTCKGSTLSCLLRMTYRRTSCDFWAFLCLSWKSQQEEDTPLGVNSPLNVASMFTTAHEQHQKNRAQIRLTAQSQIRGQGGGLEQAAGMKGGVDSCRHTQIRGQKEKSRLTALL